MLASLFWTVTALGVGAGGLWLAALFVPSAAFVLKAALDVLRTPAGQVLALLALALALFAGGWIGGDRHGAATMRAAWLAADERARVAQASREAEIRRTMRAEVDRQLAALDLYEKTVDAKAMAHVHVSPDLAACRRATDADVRRLRDIR